MAGRAPSEQEVVGYLESCSNWGRWGGDDQLGTINLITPAKRVAAARLDRDGVHVTCASPISTEITAETTLQPLRSMEGNAEGRDPGPPLQLPARRGASA